MANHCLRSLLVDSLELRKEAQHNNGCIVPRVDRYTWGLVEQTSLLALVDSTLEIDAGYSAASTLILDYRDLKYFNKFMLSIVFKQI